MDTEHQKSTKLNQGISKNSSRNTNPSFKQKNLSSKTKRPLVATWEDDEEMEIEKRFNRNLI